MCPRYFPPGNTEPTDFCHHCAIYFNLTLNKPSNIRKIIVSRALKSIDAGNFFNAGKICKSSLKYISQLTEKVVPAQSSEYLVLKNDLHVPLQSVCESCHSAQTGPLLYLHHTSLISEVIDSYKLNYCTDDTQLYLTFKTDDVNAAIESIVSCMAEISSWLGQNELKLNLAQLDWYACSLRTADVFPVVASLLFSPILQHYPISQRFQRATKRSKFSHAAWEFDVVLNSRQ